MHDKTPADAVVNGKDHDGFVIVSWMRPYTRDGHKVTERLTETPNPNGAVMSTYFGGTYSMGPLRGTMGVHLDGALVFSRREDAVKYLRKLRGEMVVADHWLIEPTDKVREWERKHYVYRARRKAQKVGKAKVA